MRRRFVAFFLIDALLALTASTFALRELFVVSAAAAALMALCFLLSLPLSRSRDAYFEVAELHVTKNDKAQLRVILRNNTVLPVLLATVRVDFGLTRVNQTFCAALLPFRRRAFVLHFKYPYIGVYPVRIASVTISDPFGLFDRRVKPFSKETHTAAVYVYPVLPVSPQVSGTDTSGYDSRPSHRLSGSESLMPIGPRFYQHGDPLRKIDWKTSAKRRELYTRQYEQNRASAAIVLVQSDIANCPEDDLFRALADAYCECALDAAHESLSDGLDVTVLDTSQNHPPVTIDGGDTLTELGVWLTTLPFTRDGAPRAFSLAEITSERVRRIVYIGAQPDGGTRNMLLAQSRAGADVTVITPLPPGQAPGEAHGLPRKLVYLRGDARRETGWAYD
jgi:hypothetical protein